jgi:hypothetical protein
MVLDPNLLFKAQQNQDTRKLPIVQSRNQLFLKGKVQNAKLRKVYSNWVVTVQVMKVMKRIQLTKQKFDDQDSDVEEESEDDVDVIPSVRTLVYLIALCDLPPKFPALEPLSITLMTPENTTKRISNVSLFRKYMLLVLDLAILFFRVSRSFLNSQMIFN